MYRDNKPDSSIPFSHGRSTNAALTDPVDGFLSDLAARKQSPGTVKKRRDDLRKLLVYLDSQEIKSFADIDLRTLEAYRFALVEYDYSDSVIESALRAASLLCRYLEEGGQLFENPARKLRIPKAPVIMGEVLTTREAKQLLAQPDLTHRRGLRDRSILEVLYSTGIRRSEAAGVSIFDIQLDQASIRVTGKGKKQRLLPLGRHAVKYLRLYLKEGRSKYLPKFAPASDALWLNRYRRPISSQSVTQLISRHGRASGIDKTIDVHTLRRTCATQMLRGGAHPVVVAQMLGHSGMSALSHYLNTTITDLMHSHSQSKPGS